MNKRVCLIILIMFLSVISFSQLKVDPMVYEFKPVKSGEMVKAKYTVKNVGSTTILIKKISTSCGCTTASKNPDQLAPGEKFELEVSLNTRGLANQVIKTIYIETNDPKNKREILKIKGKVIPEPSGKLEFEKRRIDFGTIKKGQTMVKKVKVSNTGQKDLEIVQMSLPPFFRVTLDKIKLKPGESTQATIEILPTIHGRGIKTISMLTDALYNRYQWIQISYQVK